MADPKVPGAEATAADAVATTTDKVIPSSEAIVREAVGRRQGEIRESAGLPADATTTTTTTEKPVVEELTQEQYDKWWNAQPENLRNAAQAGFYRAYNTAISEDYGDILPTILAAKENPALRAVLVELGDSTKKELLDLISDPEIRKHAKDLTRTDLRDFLLNEAITTYGKYVTAPAPAPGEKTADQLRIEQLEGEFENQKIAREFNAADNPDSYVQQRGREVSALKNAFGQLTNDQLAHIVDVAEGQYETAALRAGIKTRKEDGGEVVGWQARAIRAKVPHPGYKSYAERYVEVIGKGGAPAAAIVETRPAAGKGGEAAPRDAAEAKRQAGVTALKDFKSKSPAFNRTTTRK